MTNRCRRLAASDQSPIGYTHGAPVEIGAFRLPKTVRVGLLRPSPYIYPCFIFRSQIPFMVAMLQKSIEGDSMATPVSQIQTIYQDVLANYLISMARTVESSVE